MLGLVPQVIAKSDVRLDPGQRGAVLKAPSFHNADLLIQG
jgi:hypothetical protein